MESQQKKSVFKDEAFSPSALRRSLRDIIRGGNGDILMAINHKGIIRGALMAWHEPLTWCRKKVATDIHFVAEQGGDMLLRAFRDWAKKRGCSEICTATFNEQNEDRIERLYNRIGFRTVGKSYRMEV